MSAAAGEPEVKLGADPLAMDVRFRLVNESVESWREADGLAIGWQVLDPETGIFIAEGEWRPIRGEVAPDGAGEFEARVTLPPQPGHYRVFISPVSEREGWLYHSGEKFVLVDAEVEDGRIGGVQASVTTLTAVYWSTFFRRLPKALRLPLRTIHENRGLIRSMVRRDILARYRGSFGDVLWTVLNPLLLMATYFFVFGIVLRARFHGDPSPAGFVLYFLAGMLPWLAFSEAAGRAPLVVLEHRNFVKKLVFPVEILPVNPVAAGIVTQAFAMLIFIGFLWLARGGVPATVAWLPVLLIPQILFTLGVSWFLAALGAFVRDLGQVNGFLLTLWFFLTPICYPETSLPDEARFILRRNPLYVLVQGYRAIFLESRFPDFGPLWKLWVAALVVFFLGYAFFYKLRKSLADVV